MFPKKLFFMCTIIWTDKNLIFTNKVLNLDIMCEELHLWRIYYNFYHFKNKIWLMKIYTISNLIEVYENNFTQNNLKDTITYSIFYNLTISGSFTRWRYVQSSEYI